MTPEDWKALEMLPPSNNHDPFHDYLTIDGRLTDKGLALREFLLEMAREALRRQGSSRAGKLR